MTLEQFETEIQKKINESIESELDINTYEIVFPAFCPESYDYEHYGHRPPSERMQTVQVDDFEIDHKIRQIIFK